MKKVYWLLKIKIRFLATLLLCLVAVYVLGGRYLFTQLPSYQADIVAVISAALDRPVSLESIDGYWSNFDPVIQLNNLRIEGDESILVEAVNFRIGLLASLRAGTVRFRSLEFLGIGFNAIQQQKGWLLGGYALPVTGESDSSFDETLLEQWLEGTDINFIDTRIEVFSARGDQRQWRFPGISLRYQGDEVYASGKVIEPDSLQPLMSVSFHGDQVLSDQPVKGEIYLEARSVDFLDTVLSSYNWQEVALDSIDASGRVWASFEDFKLLSVQGEMQASHVAWNVAGKTQDPLRNLAAQFRWQSGANGSDFAFNNLAWQWQELNCQGSNGWLDYQRPDISLYLDRINLACLNRLLLAAEVPTGTLFERLETSQPQGIMKHINVTVHSSPGKDGQSSDTASINVNTGLPQTGLAPDQKAQTEKPAAKHAINARGRKADGSVSANAADKSASASGLVSTADSESGSDIEVAASDSVSTGSDSASGKHSKQADADVQSQSASGSPDAAESDLAGEIKKDNSGTSEEGSKPYFQLEANLENVELTAYESTPSVKGVYGYLYADENQGLVEFSSPAFELGLPTLFLEPWQVSKAQGTVRWQIDGEDIHVFSEGLQLFQKQGGLVYGDFILRLNPDDREDYIGLSLAMQDIAFSDVTRYVPYYEVSSDLYRWLADSLQSGRVSQGVFYGYGSVEDDDSQNSFTSSLRVDVKNGTLQFDSEWPALEELDAKLELQNDELSIVASRAGIRSTALNNLKAIMASVPENQSPILEVQAQAVAQGELLDYWLRESPIAENTSGLAEALLIEGDVNVDIRLKVPMDDQDVGYDVTTKLNRNVVTHKPSALKFEGVTGAVNVSSNRGVTADDISLSLFGNAGKLMIASVEPALESELSGQPEPANQSEPAGATHAPLWASKPAAKSTRLNLKSSVEVDTLLGHFGLNPVPGLQGEFSYTALLDIFDEQARAPELQVHSSLLGLAREWPKPFAKQADSAEDLTVTASLEDAGALVNVDLRSGLAGSIDANLRFEEQSLKAADIVLGDLRSRFYETPKRNGVWLHGAVAEADLEQWLAFIDNNESDQPHDPDALPWKGLELGIDSGTALGQQFENLTLSAMPDEAGWMIKLAGKQVAGEIMLPTEARSLAINMEHIYLKSPPEADEQMAEEVDTTTDPRELPAFSFSTKAVYLDAQNYGAWSTVGVPEPDGIRFDKLRGELGGIEFKGQMKWSMNDKQPGTFLDMRFKGGDSERFFNAIGKPPPLSSETLSGDMMLVWSDHPYEFSADKLSGTFNLSMSEGFLKTSDKKTGALRLLGIFNAEALQRRLKLDFSDIYKSGISYDDLNMKSKIDQGKLSFKEPMTIAGPSSKYEISGCSNLAKRSLNLDMKVEFPLTANVPLAALLLGAPQVGGVVWLVDKVLGEPLSSITSASYRVKGAWDNPELELK